MIHSHDWRCTHCGAEIPKGEMFGRIFGYFLASALLVIVVLVFWKVVMLLV